MLSTGQGVDAGSALGAHIGKANGWNWVSASTDPACWLPLDLAWGLETKYRRALVG
jgi:hypothetical protein